MSSSLYIELDQHFLTILLLWSVGSLDILPCSINKNIKKHKLRCMHEIKYLFFVLLMEICILTIFVNIYLRPTSRRFNK